MQRGGAVPVEARTEVVVARNGPAPNPTPQEQMKMPAMSPKDMQNKLYALPGFEEHIPAHALEATRKELEAMRVKLEKEPSDQLRRDYNKLLNRYNISSFAEEGRGGRLGVGYNTFAIIQVVDKDGNIIAVGTGKYVGGQGPHAEEIALNQIRAQIGDRKLPGSRVQVVGDKVICGERCRPALTEFAKKYEADVVEGHVFQRERLVGKGLASEKTTRGTATMRGTEGLATVEKSEVVYLRPGAKPPGGAPPGGLPGSIASEVESEPEASGAGRRRVGAVAGGLEGEAHVTFKSAVGGMLLHIGAGVALNLLQEEFKEKMLRDLANLPKPKIDRRGALEYFSDPATARSVKVIDLFNKNLKPLRKELDENHALQITTGNLEIVGIALAPGKTAADTQRRFERLDSLAQGLRTYEDQLLTLRSNLDALLELEPRSRETQKGADDLRGLLKNGYVITWLFDHGFSVEMISQLDSNLAYVSVSIQMLFDDARSLRDDVDRLLREEMDLAHGVNRIWWTEFGTQLHQLVAEDEAKRRRAAAETAPTPNEPRSAVILNADQRGMLAVLTTREGEIIFKLHQLDDAALHERNPEKLSSLRGQRDQLLSQLKDVRDRMKPYGGSGGLR